MPKRRAPVDLSAKVAADWPEMEASWAGRQIEMPTEAAGVRAIRPMNWLEQRLKPGAAAITWPWNTIAYDKGRIQSGQQDLGDLLVHELTHVGQQQRQGLLKTLVDILTASDEYLARPYEQEALKAESSRKVRRGDIELPARK